MEDQLVAARSRADAVRRAVCVESDKEFNCNTVHIFVWRVVGRWKWGPWLLAGDNVMAFHKSAIDSSVRVARWWGKRSFLLLLAMSLWGQASAHEDGDHEEGR